MAVVITSKLNSGGGGGAVAPTSQAGVPSSTPTEIGQMNLNTLTNQLYTAKGTASSTDWVEVDMGNKSLTSTSYNTANIMLGTTALGAFSDVDATNAVITLTADIPGKYKVSFKFLHYLGLGSSVNASANVFFRLTDGTTNSNTTQHVWRLNAAGVPEMVWDTEISHIFDYTTTGVKTITLQKRVFSAANLNTNVIVAASSLNLGLEKLAYRLDS